MTLKSLDQLFRLIERVLKRPWICPGEERLVRLSIEVIESVLECNVEAILFVAPLQWSLAPLPPS